MLGTKRTLPEKNFAKCAEHLAANNIQGLVVIGGQDKTYLSIFLSVFSLSLAFWAESQLRKVKLKKLKGHRRHT